MKVHEIMTVIALTALNSSVMTRAEGVLMSWSPRNLEGMTQERWEAAKKQSPKDVLKANRDARSWPDAYLCLIGAMQHKDNKSLLTGLVDQLSDSSVRSLKKTSRLIIWERIASGEVLFEGEGMQVEDDLFTTAGRANWILRTITKKNFGYVKPGASADAFRALQEKWTRWLGGEQVQEYVDPYPTTEKGIEEIRSLAALQALIVSLQPNQEKDRKTIECLHNVYHLEKLPTEPGSPGRLCSPDPWAYTYLAKITDVSGQLDPASWMNWWNENKSKLVWDSALGKFRISTAQTQPS